jgi:hypothetical protein
MTQIFCNCLHCHLRHLLRDLQVLRKADMLIGKIWLNVLARRLGLFVFAALIGVFGLGMANVAAYNALQSSIGTVWAATAVALADFVIAAIVLFLAMRSRPGGLAISLPYSSLEREFCRRRRTRQKGT